MRVSLNTNTSNNTPSRVFSPVTERGNAPARVLNECGKAYIDRWVVANATEPAKQSLPAWHRYATVMANQATEPAEWVIEMEMSQTKSGYPEELRCPPQWFEAVERA